MLVAAALSALSSALNVAARPAMPHPSNALHARAVTLDTDAISRQHFGNDAAWYSQRIPFFESADSKLTDVYYYRWKIFRAHQRDLGEFGYITTEFMDDVSWQLNPWASLNDATGFHIGEGRWSRDRRFTDDYITFMYQRGGNDRHFTDYMADSTYGRYLVDGDAQAATQHVQSMQTIFGQWNDHLDTNRGLYYVDPIQDATEYTVASIDATGGQDGFLGGSAYRPSINSYMYANAVAISKLLTMSGQSPAQYDTLAADIKAATQNSLWNDALGHFMDRFHVDNQYVKQFDFIRNRELVGMVPFMFNLPDNNGKYTPAWSHVLDPNELASPVGLRTVGPSYQYYMRQYRYEGSAPECQWNGPIWPYQTTQVLLALANVLDTYDQNTIGRSDFVNLLSQYTNMHYQGDLLNLEEDYYPDTGKPIVGLARSNHYFHSGFVDVVIAGLVGLRPSAGDEIKVNPAITAQSMPWFHVQDVPYHGHSIAITWDADGSHYNQGAGLKIAVDGAEVASRPDLGVLTAPLSRKANPAIDRPIAQSIQLLASDQFPKPSASSGTNADNLHEGIDGRTVFFADGVNGWASDATPSESQQWFAIDFGKTVSLSRAELAFFDDGNAFAAPTQYTLQSWDGSAWQDIQNGFGETLLPNGITNVNWPALSTSQFRVTFTQPANKRTRLVEFKLF